MRGEKLFENICDREIYLYGNMNDVGETIDRYGNLLNIQKILTDLTEEVRLQPFLNKGLETLLFDQVDFSADVLVVICDSERYELRRRRLQLINKTEYRDYCSCELLDALIYHKKLVLCMGTSLVRQVKEVLESNAEVSAVYSIVYFAEDELLRPYANRMVEYIHISKYCDVYICSSCEKEGYGRRLLKREVLPEACCYITISDYGFRGYFPTVNSDRDHISDYLLREYERKKIVYGLLYGAREDSAIVSLCKCGCSVEEITDRLLDEEYLSKDRVLSYFEQELQRFEELEVQDTIQLGAFISEHRQECLCWNLDEWSWQVVLYVSNEILRQLGLQVQLEDVTTLVENRAGTQLPIYPCVQKALNLKKKSTQEKFKVVTSGSSKYLSLRQYIEYLAHYTQKAMELLDFTGMDQTLIQQCKEDSDMVTNVLEYLERAARKYPNKVAFVDEYNNYTYSELKDYGRALGTTICKNNINKEPIIVYLEKSVKTIAAFIGVLYSGNFYCPIDTSMPMERVKMILDVSASQMIITDLDHMQTIKAVAPDASIVLYDEAIQSKIDVEKLNCIRRGMIDMDPMYVLFTSGSTGIPKGVVITHQSVIEYTEWVSNTFGITSDDSFGNQAPFYFDNSILDIYCGLRNCATVYIIPKECFGFPAKLMNYLNENRITTIFFVPSALIVAARLKAMAQIPLKTVNKVLFCGEVMPNKYLNIWRKYLPNALYANLYGPTEITDVCTYYIVDREFADDEPLPIGRPCENTDVIILNEKRQEATNGEIGELCIRGRSLALGYYSSIEKSREVFIQNPLNNRYRDLIYCTGDLVKLNEHGEILYMGRKDSQIKHMGHRIELGEIEVAAGGIEEIEDCACIYDNEKNKIVFFYRGIEVEHRQLKRELNNKIPDYMIPEKIIRISEFPYNTNGKIDRKRLKEEYLNGITNLA